MNASQNSLLEEIKSGMDQIEETIESMSSKSDNYLKILDLRKNSEWVTDLSMIHGFEGVQNISEKLNAAINHSIDAGEGLTQELLTKVRQAVAAMREVANLESNIEQHLTVENVTERAELDRIKVFDRTLEFSKSVTNLQAANALDDFEDKVEAVEPVVVDEAEPVDEPETEAPNPDIQEVHVAEVAEPVDLLFDITEAGSIMDLIEDPSVLAPEREALDMFGSDDDEQI